MPTGAQLLREYTDEELLQLLQQLEAEQGAGSLMARQGGLLSAPAVEPTGNESLLQALGNAGQNLPFSLAERGRELYGVASDLPGAARGIWSLLKGTGDLASGAFGGDDQTPEAQMARQVGSALAKDFTSEGFQRDPLAPISTAATALSGAGVGRLLGKTGKAALAAAADPAMAMLGGAAKVAAPVGRKAMGLVGDVAAEGLGFTTGMQAPRIREAWRAGRSGEFMDFWRSITDNDSKKRLGKDVIAGLREEEQRLGQIKGDFVKENANVPVNTQGLLEEVLAVLNERQNIGRVDDVGTGIARTPRRDYAEYTFPEEFSPEATQRVEQALRVIEGLGDSTPLSVMDSKKQAVSQLFRPLTREGVSVTGINKAINRRLDAVPGYSEVNQEYSKIKDFIEEVGDDLNVQVRTKNRPKGKPKQAGRGMDRATMEGHEDDLLLLQKIENITGIPVRSRAAGQSMSQWMPRGLVARSVGVGTAGTAAAGVAPLGSLYTIPLFSPILVGSVVSATGAGTQMVEAAINRLRYAARNMPGITDAITLGELLERAEANQ